MKNFIKKNKFIIFLFSLAFIIRLIYVLIIDTPIISDFKTMYDASLELINGTTNYKNMPYFLLWSYQMGHVIYQALLLSICNSITFLEIINCIITSLTVVLIYLICKMYASDKSSKIVSILYLFFPFPLFMNSVLSNQQLSLLLILISIYLFLNISHKKYIRESIIIGILLGISNVIRSEAIVIIVSLFLYTVLSIKRNFWKKPLICFLLIILMYTAVFNCTSSILKISNISPNGLKNSNPAWKFVTGLNYYSGGSYSQEDAYKYASNYDLAKKEVFNRLKIYQKLPSLFVKKINTLWIKSDLYWPLDHISSRTIYTTLTIINQYFIYIFIILSILSFKCLSKMPPTHKLSFIILFIYFEIYLFIEVMPRYAYNLQPFEVILSAFGLDRIFKYLKRNS